MLKNVLIVDDAPTIRRLIQLTLGTAEYTCTEVNDGAQALKMLEDKKFDLIISDLNMPGIDGLQMLEQIRKKFPAFTTPILMSTSDSNIDNIKLAKKHGISGWIIKPFSTDVLKKAVHRSLGIIG